MIAPLLSVLITNISAGPITITELNDYVLAPGQTVDMLDETLPHYYREAPAAIRAVTQMPNTSLYQQRAAGNIMLLVRPR